MRYGVSMLQVVRVHPEPVEGPRLRRLHGSTELTTNGWKFPLVARMANGGKFLKLEAGGVFELAHGLYVV